MVGCFDGLTVRFDLPVVAFNDLAQLGPFGEVLEVEADVVCFGQVVEITWIELEEICACHGTDERHCELGRVRFAVLYVVDEGTCSLMLWAPL